MKFQKFKTNHFIKTHFVIYHKVLEAVNMLLIKHLLSKIKKVRGFKHLYKWHLRKLSHLLRNLEVSFIINQSFIIFQKDSLPDGFFEEM